MYPSLEDFTEGVARGTTTIGVVCKDGVVLATDTRATMGYFIAHKRAKKVYPIADHLAMTIAGAVGDAQAVVDILKANAELYRLQSGVVMPVSAAARLVANILFSARLTPLLLQALIGGVDSAGPRIFALDPLGSVTEETCVSTGSGSPIAYGVLESQFREGMAVKDAVPVVLKAVTSAMKRDAASGDSFDVAMVTRDGYREVGEEEKKTLVLRS
ncbi:archaeal proteasome endopeptidase complex subunit beta [Candidatus Bathyarchaeota archaeon]|nr:archaeal proteasome endopeptidase complex subunit beta [Candidatus Bathyarchaeota archaeon]